MENIHLKNLNSEKTLKELAKNPKAYLFYVFQQNYNGEYPLRYMFKQLPIIEEFDNTIIEILYEITKEKIITIDKLIKSLYNENEQKIFYNYLNELSKFAKKEIQGQEMYEILTNLELEKYNEQITLSFYDWFNFYPDMNIDFDLILKQIKNQI